MFVRVRDVVYLVVCAGAPLSLVDLTEADWALFDEQVFKMGSAQDSSPGQFKVRECGGPLGGAPRGGGC